MLSVFDFSFCLNLLVVLHYFVIGCFFCLVYTSGSRRKLIPFTRRVVLFFPFVYTTFLSLLRFAVIRVPSSMAITGTIFSFAVIFLYFYLLDRKQSLGKCSWLFVSSALVHIIREFCFTINFGFVYYICLVFNLPNSKSVNNIYNFLVLVLVAVFLWLFHKCGFVEQKIIGLLSLHWEFPIVLVLCLASTTYIKWLIAVGQTNLDFNLSPYCYVLLSVLPTYLLFCKIVIKYTCLKNENKNYRIEKQPLIWILHQESTNCPAISTARGSLSALSKYESLTKGFIKNLKKLDIDYSCEGFAELVFSMFLTYMSLGIRYLDYKKDIFDVVEDVFELPKDCDFVKNRIAKIIRKSWITSDREVWEKEYFDECFINVISGKKKAPSVNEFLFNMVRKSKISIDELVNSKECIGNMISRSAGLISIDGDGVLITGESGVGKSEAAWELLNQGCCLVADDVVEIRRIGNNLYGNGCKETKDFMEARGLGIVNVKGMFGSRAVKDAERIDLIVNLVKCENTLDLSSDLVGSDVCYAEIMGVLVPYVTISARSEKSVSNLIKIAAMNNRRRFLGFAASEELFKNIGMKNDSKNTSKNKFSIIDESKVFGC